MHRAFADQLEKLLGSLRAPALCASGRLSIQYQTVPCVSGLHHESRKCMHRAGMRTGCLLLQARVSAAAQIFSVESRMKKFHAVFMSWWPNSPRVGASFIDESNSVSCASYQNYTDPKKIFFSPGGNLEVNAVSQVLREICWCSVLYELPEAAGISLFYDLNYVSKAHQISVSSICFPWHVNLNVL